MGTTFVGTTECHLVATVDVSSPVAAIDSHNCTMNIVVIQGILSSEPVERTLPSGETLTSLEVTTRADGEPARSVPVVTTRSVGALSSGDEVVVVGWVRRRFFRAAGSTQSRTEVEARSVLRAGHSVRVARLIDAVRDELSAREA